MKNLMSLSAAALLLLTACKNTTSADTAASTEKQEASATNGTSFSVDTTTSSIGWTGAKLTGAHNGIFKLTEGSLSADNGSINGGSFTINMASLKTLDLQGDEASQLEGHLKSPDFFQTDKFPSAKFVITQVAPFDSTKESSKLPGATHFISGNLTLKDSTKNISFPAVVTVNDQAVTAKADFSIDRTQWGINYKGPNNPADWMIKKEVNLAIDLKATKK